MSGNEFVNGLELHLHYAPSPGWVEVEFGYTYQEANTDSLQFKLPRNSWNLGLVWKPLTWWVSADLRGWSSYDPGFGGDVDGAEVLSLAAGLDFPRGYAAYARIDNVLDTDYVRNRYDADNAYATAGIAFTLGLEASW